ncbi:thioredoxin family protein [Jeotgalicoccus saudimassiliensis]|nr:thioredoxin family protein [Jeotgalicoccus saudimassiliensis]
MCKTCDIAETMLSVAASTRGISYERINLNFYKTLIEVYQIRSAPALLLFKNGRLVKEVYAFQSVTYLNEVLTEFLIDED